MSAFTARSLAAAIVAGRALIAQRGYPATVGGIRALRQEMLRSKDGTIENSLTTYRDFYGASGCRDLLSMSWNTDLRCRGSRLFSPPMT